MFLVNGKKQCSSYRTLLSPLLSVAPTLPRQMWIPLTREAVANQSDFSAGFRRCVAEKIDGQWVTHQWLKKAATLFPY